MNVVEIKHQSVDGVRVDDDGWVRSVCECGFSTPPLPDTETLLDVMMQHVELATSGDAE